MLFQLSPNADIEDMDLFWDMRGSAFTIDFDVFTQALNNSLHEFVLYSTVARISLQGGLNSIDVFEWPQYPPAISHQVQPFADGVPHHFTISADFTQHLWSLSVNGVLVYSSFTSSPDTGGGIGFRLCEWYQGAAFDPDVMVALDNIRVEVVPEPSVGALVLGCASRLLRAEGCAGCPANEQR